MTSPYDIISCIEATCGQMREWLRGLPEWPKHPVNWDGGVASSFGPALLGEHDCVLHFARYLQDAGVPWVDQHVQFRPAQWMYTPPADTWKRPPAVDLAVIPLEQLLAESWPAPLGERPLDVALEFKHASNYWKYGRTRHPEPVTTLRSVEDDIEKVAAYLKNGLARVGYVIVVEETDHGFPAEYDEPSVGENDVRVRVLRRYRPSSPF